MAALTRTDDTGAIPLRAPIRSMLVYPGEHESIARAATPVRDFVVSRTKDRHQGWALARDGRWAASFGTYEDAVEVARHWAADEYARDRAHEVRVLVEWIRGRLELDVRYEADAERFARSA